MIELIEASSEYLEEYKEAYLETLEQIKLGNTSKHNLLFLNPDEEDVVQAFKDSRDQSKLPAHYVPSYDYFVVDGSTFIGIIHIRVRLTENLIRYGGHIGYAVRPKFWNKGYGKEILRLGLEKARDLIEDEKILITCDDTNIGSYKVIEANGGILENKVENEDQGEKFLSRRYWINK